MESLSDVAVFVEVVRRNSFTAAAEQLDMSRSAVSKHVSRLEDRLGARLLNRTTRRLSLTEIGQAFFDRSRAALQELEDAKSEVARLQSAPRGRLRISAPMAFGLLHVAPVLADFLRRYPDVTVDLDLDDRSVDVVDNGFDVAIRIASLADSSLIARRLSACRHVVCASPEYLARRGRPERPDDLRKHAVIACRNQDAAHEWTFVQAGSGPVSVAVPAGSQMNSSLAIRAAVLRHAGIARLPTYVVGPDLRSGSLVRVLPDCGIAEALSIYAIYPTRRHLSPKVRAFVDFMAETVTDPPAWDAAADDAMASRPQRRGAR